MTGEQGDDANEADQELWKVLKHQADAQDRLLNRIDAVNDRLEARIKASEAVLRSVKWPIPPVPTSHDLENRSTSELQPRPWAALVREAELAYPSAVSVTELLTEEELRRVLLRIESLRNDFDRLHRLDAIDWCIAGVAGAMGAIVDTFLVVNPSSPGIMGSAPLKGGPLSDFLRDRLRNAYSQTEIAELERKFRVPFDVVHSGSLAQDVPGLGPRTHRFHSLGHDPLLGFIFGVADILQGRITTIDSRGVFTRQPSGAPQDAMGIFGAIAHEFGHLQSDVATTSGLPAPLLPLLNLLQVGSFGKGGHTVGEMARLMHARGYNFGHFLAMSVPTLLIEVLVRVAYFVKRLSEGHELADALPFSIPGRPPQPKLNTMLFTAHLIAAATNGGRAALTKNPLAINYPEWIVFGKVALQQLRWVLYQKEQARFNFVQSRLDADWESLQTALAEAPIAFADKPAPPTTS